MLENHPWYEVTLLAASANSAGQKYADVMKGRWALKSAIPATVAGLTVQNASDVKAIADAVDFVFCAVDMTKEETAKLEEDYARAETPVVSNNSAHRGTPDVPMMIPEVNPDHVSVIEAQRKRLGTKRGFVAVKPNCSLQSYVPAIHPLREVRSEADRGLHVPGDLGRGEDLRDLAGDDRQRHPVHQGRGGEERAGADEDLGLRRGRQASRRRRARSSPRSASASP